MKYNKRLYLKICGMHQNIQEVAALQPDFLGFIFWETSARFYEGKIPDLPTGIKKAGVFVDAPIREIIKRSREHSLEMIQLHGSESPRYCEELNVALEGLKGNALREKKPSVIKVFSVGEDFNFNELNPYEGVCDFFMFDTKGKLPGGNGFAFNWKLLQNYPSQKPFFLSGGIGPEDADKLKEFKNSKASRHCFAIDVNSRFETAPGLKDTEKLKKFIKEFNGN